MKNKGMKKLLSKVWKSGVANYTRMHWSSYVYKWSWAWRARVVLGEFQDMTVMLISVSHDTIVSNKHEE